MREWMDSLSFDQRGLLPVVVQEEGTGMVLMVAYLNREALEQTLSTGRTVFYSRRRQALWSKGETSGHYQLVRAIAYDCDADTLLIQVEQVGSACHTGHRSCFFRWVYPEPEETGEAATAVSDPFPGLYRLLRERKAHPVDGSYTAALLAAGLDRILKKIGEEAGEVIIATKNEDRTEIIHEVADLWFHTLVLLGDQGIEPGAVYAELARRRKGERP